MASLVDKCDPALKRSFAKGTILLPEGQNTGRLYVLAAGSVEVLRGDTQVAAVSDAGAVFGEMSVLLGTPHTATVRALTDCEAFEYQNAEAFMSSDPAITFAIARLLAQ